MPKQVQFRRGNTNQNNNFTGAPGEISVNEDSHAIRVHDGTNTGGYELARADLTNAAGITSISVSGIISATNISGVDASFSGIVTAPTFIGNLTGTATTATKLETTRTFEITGDIVASSQDFDGTQNVSLASSIQPNTVGLGTHTYGDYVKNITGTAGEIEVSVEFGEGVSPQIGLPDNVNIANNLTVTNDLQVTHDLNVNGNITVGGTSAYLIVDSFFVKGQDIITGFSTDSNSNEVSNDITANSGGIAVASTEGNPIINLNIVGIETLPPTYKKLMWFKAGAFAGLNTDAWMFNYGVGIGSTQIPNGVRLAVGDVQINDFDISKARNINASGIITSSTINASSLNVSGISSLNQVVTNHINSSGIVTATTFSTGVNGIGINTNTIYGPEVMFIDPSTVGDNTGILRIKGDLYVDGTQTVINSTTLEVADLQIGIATTAINDVVLDGAGIGIGSTPRKTFTWEYLTSSFKSSENLNLSLNKTYKINGIDVLTSNSLGSGITSSVLTSVGTLNQLNVSGIVTANSFRPSSGYIQAPDGTNSFYIYSGTGNVAFQGTISVSQINNSSGNKVIGFAGTNITFENHAYIAGITTSIGGFVGNLTGTATTATNVSGGIASVSSLTVSGVSTLGIVTSSNIFSTGIVTASGGFNLGISSAGTAITTSPIRTLNFIGVGNTFNVNGTTVDISIQGGGGTSSQWVTVASGIYTGSNVGIGTSILSQPFQVGSGSTVVVVTGIGSVGIGTTSPAYKIDVVGDVRVSGIISATSLTGAATTAFLPTTFSAGTIGYATTVNLDMSTLNGKYNTISLTGDLTFTTSNRDTGRNTVLRLICDTTNRNLTFPAGWVFIGAKPSGIASSKTAVLSLSFFGTADTDCVAAYGAQI